MPNFQRLSRAARTRWTAMSNRTAIHVASKKMVARFGGSAYSPGPLSPLTVAHDLILAQAFMLSPFDQRSDWVGEAVYGKQLRGSRCPDAFLCVDGNIEEPYCVAESLGSYGPRHIEEHFRYAALRLGLRWQGW